MSASAETVRVMPVPVPMIGAMWPAVWPYIERGNQVANLDPERLLVDLATLHAVLWCVFVNDGLAAAYFSSVEVHDDGRKSLMVYGLGGRDLRAWLPKQIEVMEAHARGEGCQAAGFYGVKAWTRLVPPEYEATPAPDGAVLYSRALQ